MKFITLKALLLMAGFALLFQGCADPKPERSELFTKLFGDESGDFRGIEVGSPLENVKETEPGSPKTSDRFGYVYQINLGQDKYAMVEYMSKDQPDPTAKRIVNAIVVNVFLKDEGETSDIYRESEAFIRGRHEVPEGNFGDYEWVNEDEELVISLRLLDDKKSFSLNFAPIKGI